MNKLKIDYKYLIFLILKLIKYILGQISPKIFFLQKFQNLKSNEGF